ncbi:MAG: VanW family protein [Labilithrix sp.]|nr:VanW family protein [Labilithrix sp.]MCW5815927.1 VanW family protein [Labilithrix sp.]
MRYVPPARRPHRWGLRIGLAAAMFAALGAGAFAAKGRWFPDARVLPGVKIDGVTLPAGADPKAFADERATALLARKVSLHLGGKSVLEGTLGELGVRVDTARSAAFAERVGKDGDVLGRAYAADEAREGRVDVPLFVSLDREAALSRLVALKEVEDTQPVSARLDLDKHETIAERDGHYIDADETLAAIEETARAARGADAVAITLPTRSFVPRVSSAFLKSLEISAVVAEYETFFSRSGDQSRRGKNIDNAAQKLDGLVISPGEMVSFNEVIGERSESNGFEKSWEIFKGEMVEGIGGGTCQVASTFHAAIFFGGFDVLERLPHSRPSAYIPMGLDSTVVYPAVDLKVRNPHPFPVVVHAKTVGGKLRVELLGKEKPVKVGFSREVDETIPYKRKIEEDPTLSGKKVVVKQHGIKGYKIKITRTFTYANGTKRKTEEKDQYPPTTEIYKVPVGFDVAQLPSLPEEDEELGGNPAPAPPEASTPTAPGTDPTAAVDPDMTSKPESEIEFVDAPGAHAPTAQQRDPSKTLHLRR